MSVNIDEISGDDYKMLHHFGADLPELPTWETAREEVIFETAQNVPQKRNFGPDLAARVLHVALRPSVCMDYFRPFCKYAMEQVCALSDR